MFNRGLLTGHTAAILEEMHAMICDGLRRSATVCDASRCLKIAAKCPFSSHRVAGP